MFVEQPTILKLGRSLNKFMVFILEMVPLRVGRQFRHTWLYHLEWQMNCAIHLEYRPYISTLLTVFGEAGVARLTGRFMRSENVDRTTVPNCRLALVNRKSPTDHWHWSNGSLRSSIDTDQTTVPNSRFALVNRQPLTVNGLWQTTVGYFLFSVLIEPLQTVYNLTVGYD